MTNPVELLSDGETVYDPQDWLSKETVRSRYGIPARSLERSTVKKLYHKPPFQRAIAVYWRPEVEELAEQRAQPRIVRPKSAEASAALPTPRASTIPAEREPPYWWEALRQSFEELAARLAYPVNQKIYLTLEEARAYTGLSEKALKALAAEGKIARAPGRLWRLRRRDLDQL